MAFIELFLLLTQYLLSPVIGNHSLYMLITLSVVAAGSYLGVVFLFRFPEINEVKEILNYRKKKKTKKIINEINP